MLISFTVEQREVLRVALNFVSTCHNSGHQLGVFLWWRDLEELEGKSGLYRVTFKVADDSNNLTIMVQVGEDGRPHTIVGNSGDDWRRYSFRDTRTGEWTVRDLSGKYPYVDIPVPI